MVFEMFFLKIHLKNHFVGSLQPFCSGVGLGASTFWLPQPNPPNSKWDCLHCFTLFCEMWDSWVQPVQRFAAGSLAMRSYSAMERQSAAATGVKKETADSHGFVPGDAWWWLFMVMHGDDWIWMDMIGEYWWCMVMHGDAWWCMVMGAVDSGWYWMIDDDSGW